MSAEEPGFHRLLNKKVNVNKLRSVVVWFVSCCVLTAVSRLKTYLRTRPTHRLVGSGLKPVRLSPFFSCVHNRVAGLLGRDDRRESYDKPRKNVSKMTPTEALMELMLLPMTATAPSQGGAGGAGEKIPVGYVYMGGGPYSSQLLLASVI